MAEKKKIKVSKVDAARRQLDCAIQLWFKDGDDISIHTLVAAAYEIIQDLNTKAGSAEFNLIEIARKIAPPEHVEEVMQHLKKPMNFFKHANRDPHAILEFWPETNELHMVLAMNALELLGERRTDLIDAFASWLALHRPELYSKEKNPLGTRISSDQLAQMRRIKRSDFLNQFLVNRAQLASR